MKTTINDITFDFQPWRPEHGKVFDSAFAFDCETTRIDEQRPWISPAYVLGAAFDGTQGYFIRREHVAAFFTAHQGVAVVMHNGPFDLAVIGVLAPDLDIYSWVDQDLVWDTQLLHRGYMLATEGHTASGRGQSTLEHCAERYLGVTLPKDLKRQARVKATLQDTNLSEVIRGLLTQWLETERGPSQEVERNE